MSLKEVLRLEVEAQSLHRKNWDGADNVTQELKQSHSGESPSRCLCELNRSWMDECSQKLARVALKKINSCKRNVEKKNMSDSAAQQICVSTKSLADTEAQRWNISRLQAKQLSA